MIVFCTNYTSTYTWFNVLKVDEGKNKKRTNETGSQTPVPTKKAKDATPEKTGNVIIHTALYYTIRVVNGNTFSTYSISVWHMIAYATND